MTLKRSNRPMTSMVAPTIALWRVVAKTASIFVVALGVMVRQVETVTYGVDVSFPMHHVNASINYPWLPHNADPVHNPVVPPEYQGMPLQPLGDRQSEFNSYLQGCVHFYADKAQRCLDNERDRIRMSLRQPKGVRNYTENGFTKIRAPDHVFKLLKEFWDANKDRATAERWAVGNIYTNHWSHPTYMVSVENSSMKGGGHVLKQHIWNAARDTIQAWTGQKLSECSLYGIRVYKDGAVLATHVDRLPLVASAIINVDQDTDEPWPLEVIGHDGLAHNVTMEPGDLVLYESHSVLHGRPFPLKGRFMANVFIHFEPIGPMGGEVEVDGDLPPYVIPGSEQEVVWRKSNRNGHKLLGHGRSVSAGSTEAHLFARRGDLSEVRRILNDNEKLVNARDRNGWTPLHEAVRYGDVDLVRFLLNRGADPSARAGKRRDGSDALGLAVRFHGEGSPVADLFREKESITEL